MPSSFNRCSAPIGREPSLVSICSCEFVFILFFSPPFDRVAFSLYHSSTCVLVRCVYRRVGFPSCDRRSLPTPLWMPHQRQGTTARLLERLGYQIELQPRSEAG